MGILKREKKGQGLVEFALILPVLLLILLGVIEAGWLIWSYITVQNAAREAARYAVTGAPLDVQGNPWTVKPMREAGDPPGEPNRSDAIKQVAVNYAAALPIDVLAIQNYAQFEDEQDTPRAFGVGIRGQVDPDDIEGTEDHPGDKGLNIIVRVYYNAPMLDPIYNALMGGNTVQLVGQVAMQNEGVNLALGGELPEFAPPDPDKQAGEGGEGSGELDEYLDVRYEGSLAADVPAGSDVDINLERHAGNRAYYICFEGAAIPQSPVNTNASGSALVSGYTISLLTTAGTKTFHTSLSADCSDQVATYQINIVDPTEPSIIISDAGHTEHGWPANSLVNVFISGHDPNTEYQVYFDGNPMPDNDAASGGVCRITTGANKAGSNVCVIPNTATVGVHQLSTDFTPTPYEVEVTDATLLVKGGEEWPDSTYVSVILRGHAPRHNYFVFLGNNDGYVNISGSTTGVTTNSNGDLEFNFLIPQGYDGDYKIITQDANSPLPKSSASPVGREIAETPLKVFIPTIGNPIIVVQGGYTWPAGSTMLVTLRGHAAETTYDVNFAEDTVIREMTTDISGSTPAVGERFEIPDAMSTGDYEIISFLSGSTTVFSTTRTVTVNAAPYLEIAGGNVHPPNTEITILLRNHAANTSYDVYLDLDGLAGNGPNGGDAEYLIEAGIVTDNNGEASVNYLIDPDISPTGVDPEDAHLIETRRDNRQVADVELFVDAIDLTVTDIRWPTDPQPGVDLPIEIEVTNNKAITLSGIVFDNDLYIDPSPGVPTYTQQLPPGDRKIWIDGIGPNETKVITTNIRVFNLGTYQLWGRADTSNQVGESTENNNLRNEAMVLTCNLPDTPDNFDDGSIGEWILHSFGNADAGNGWDDTLQLASLPPDPTAPYQVETAGLDVSAPGGPLTVQSAWQPLVPTTEAAPATLPAATQALIPLGQTTYTVLDTFSTQAYNNNDGTQNWAGNWIENNDDNSGAPDAGEIRIINNTLKVERDSDRTIEREADLTGATSATLSFNYQRDGLDNASEGVALDVSDDGGASWTEIATFAGSNNDNSPQAYSTSLNSYISGNTRIRFRTYNLENSDRVYFDNVQISYEVPPPNSTSIKVNFQLGTAAVPGFPDYLVDAGNSYASRGNGYSYGWYLSNGTASTNATTRNRDNGSSPDERYDTLIHMQQGGTYYWEIAVPNGTYTVRMVAGDPSFTDSYHRISAEGVLVVDENTSNSGNNFAEGTQTVTVSDGALTIATVSGADNAKLAFLEIISGTVTPPPADPTNLTATVTGASGSETIQLQWDDNATTPNESYYIIERSTDGTNWTELGQTAGADINTFTDSTAVCNTDYSYRVRAYSATSGAFSGYSNTATARFDCPAVVCNASTPFLQNGASQIVMEAEHYTTITPGSNNASGSTWTLLTDNDASNGEAMQATPNSGVNVQNTSDGPRMTYWLNFDTAGTYYVYVLARGPSTNDDSIHVALDNLSPVTAVSGGTGLTGFNGSSYSWVNQVNGNPVVVTVASNQLDQTIPFYVWMREDGSIVDKIALIRANSDPGAPASATETPCVAPVPPYPAPSNLSAVQGVDASLATLTWTDNTHTANSQQEDRFIVERSSDGGSTFTQVGTTGTDITTFADSNLVCDQQYIYRVRAQRDSPADTSEPSGTANLTNPCPPVDPDYDAPTNIAAVMNTVSVGVYEAAVSWTLQTNDETQVQLQRTDDGGTTWSNLAVLAGGTTSYTDSTVQCGANTYAYRVRVYRSYSKPPPTPQTISDWSDPVSNDVSTGDCPPTTCDASGELDGQLHLCSSGTGIMANNDDSAGYLFIHQPISSRAFDMVVRLNSLPNQTNDSLAGLEVRETTSGQAKKVSLVIRNGAPANVGAFARTTDGGAVAQVGSWTDTDGLPPTWLRIVRANGKFYYYYNARIGTFPVIGAWNLLGSTADTMGANVEVGMINASGNGTRSPSTWSSFRISCLAIPTAEECGVVDEANGLGTTNAVNYTDTAASSDGSDAWQRTETPTGGYPAMYYNGSNYTNDTNFNFDDYFAKAPSLEYGVNIQTPGIYYVWLLGYSPNSSGDSIHIGFDGVRETYLEAGSGAGLYWFNSQGNGRAYSKQLSQGVHTINFWGREDDFQLVQVLVTNLPPDEYSPTGSAPIGQSACMEPVPPEFPAFLEQCSGNLLQQPGFESGGAGDQNPWVYINGSSRGSAYRYTGSFGVFLPATPLSGYPRDRAPELRQSFNMPDWINETTTMMLSMKTAVLKTPNPDDPIFSIDSPNDHLYLTLRNQAQTDLTSNIGIADGDDDPPGGIDNNIVPPDVPDNDFNSINNRDLVSDFFGSLLDLQDLGGQTVEARFFAPNPAQLTPGLPTNDPSRYSTVFWLDDLKIEVCTEQPPPSQETTKGTIKGELQVLLGSRLTRVEGVTVWAYAIDPPGPVQTTYSVNTGFGLDNYSFYNVDPGEYVVYAEYVAVDGTSYGALRSVTVRPNRISSLDLTLLLGGAQ